MDTAQFACQSAVIHSPLSNEIMPQEERAAILAELTPGHTIVEPAEHAAPFVLCSPHSGSIYPTVLQRASKLDAHGLRKSEDCYVDQLFAEVSGLGAPMIAARFPRAYLDVNREPYELDPELFGRELPSYANHQSVRVAGGLGTIARIVADGEEIYRTPPSLPAALERVELLYKPFHEDLSALMERTHAQFGMAILIDCHSMPSAAMSQSPGNRPDVVIGDRFGSSCDQRLTRMIRDRLGKLGYQVQLNRPYAGGFITEHYGRPQRGFHALQVEINRALYLDEKTLERTRGFDRLRQDLTSLCRYLFAELAPPATRRQAAE
jgi:N-formylglutamate amidohydrolase